MPALAQDDPSLFLQRFPAPLLIHEIQDAPNLLPGINMRVDADKKAGAFWVTGSQQVPVDEGRERTLPPILGTKGDRMANRLAGKVAMVTGGASRIGEATCR